MGTNKTEPEHKSRLKISRRAFLGTVAAGTTGAGLTATPFHIGMSSPASLPNVIIVTMDTTGRRHPGCYGYHRNTSPNLDAFADDAIFFEDFYSTGCNTITSHASILTGQHPHNHGTIHPTSLEPTAVTLPLMLKQKGYQTGAVTSISFLDRNCMGIGFDHFSHPESGDYTRENIVGDDGITRDRETRKTVEIALDYVDHATRQTDPFFLWMHIWEPHSPYTPPDEDVERICESQELLERARKSPRDLLTKSFRFNREQQEVIRLRYDSEIAHMDIQIGRFLDHLKASGVYENSILVLTADHGEALFENTDVPDRHSVIDEPVVQIPGIVRCPGLKPRRVAGLTQNIDLAPTILARLGYSAGDFETTFDGLDLTPMMEGETELRNELYLSQTGNRSFAVVTRDKKKLKMPILRRTQRKKLHRDWGDDPTLPRIELTSGDLEEMLYEDTEGQIHVSWKHPENVQNVNNFLFLWGRKRGILIGVLEKETDFTIPKMSERAWDASIAIEGRIPYKIIALDSTGKKVAESDTKYIGAVTRHNVGIEFFDLNTDPDERNNLVSLDTQERRELAARLERFGKESEHLIDEEMELNENTQSKLQALGYF